MTRNQRLVVPALAILSVGGHASALELDEVDIQSSLGEPLRASIAYALGPREEIGGYCIFLNTGRSSSGLPSVGPVSIALSDGAIRLTGKTPVREPLIGLQVTVDCPSAAHLSREYFAFLNPEAFSEPNAIVEPATNRTVLARAAEPAHNPPAVPRRVQRMPITASVSYRVQPGDTLSGIAQRISGRSVNIWQAADVLFAANPDAFIGNDPNLLKAGALLRIPDRLHDGGTIEARTASTGPVAAATGTPSTVTTAYAGYPATPRSSSAAEDARAAAAPVQVAAPVEVARPAEVAVPAEAVTPAEPATPVPSPGDILLDADGSFVSPIEAPVNAGDVPATGADPGERSAANARSQDRGSSSWLMWLAGSGVALILGLLLFSRPLRRRFGGAAPEPLFEESSRRRRKTDVDAEGGSVEIDVDAGVDFGFDEDPADARIIALDGDLGAGTGFQDTGDIDVAQDFGFSASDDIRLGLDMEFSDEPAAILEEDSDRITSALPLATAEETELPGDTEETGDYDLSMVVDATNQRIGNGDATTKDLRAVEVESASVGSDDVTLEREVDYRILEQDYEDELTATQALNAELNRAARQLVESARDATDRTAVLPPPADEISLESTVEMTAARSETDRDDSGDTNVNEQLSTAPPAAENDATVEMEIESASNETRKQKVS